MSLTPLRPNSRQVSSGMTPPPGPPDDPSVDNIFYQLDAGGTVQTVYYWDILNATWVPSSSGANWSEGLECGWQGPHDALHYAPSHCEVALPCSLVPRFSVAVASTAPIPFQLLDTSDGTTVIATGEFPAGAKFASAAECSLVDGAAAPVASLLFVPTPTKPVVHYAAVPVGGHTAMPPDGETFTVSFAQTY